MTNRYRIYFYKNGNLQRIDQNNYKNIETACKYANEYCNTLKEKDNYASEWTFKCKQLPKF